MVTLGGILSDFRFIPSIYTSWLVAIGLFGLVALAIAILSQASLCLLSFVWRSSSLFPAYRKNEHIFPRFAGQ
jgi:hypothetical protein